MNSNFLFKQLIIFSFLTLLSCDDNIDTVSGRRNGPGYTPKVKELPHKPKAKPSDKICPSRFVSTKTACFYTIPDLPHGEYYKTTFEDDGIYYKAKDGKLYKKPKDNGVKVKMDVIVGKGKWYCDNGDWKTVEKPSCMTCKPESGLKYCWNEWRIRR